MKALLDIVPFTRELLPLLQSRGAFERFSPAKHTQLQYVAGRAQEQGCTAIAIETRYVDRDFMEDYAVFYSRNLQPLPNYCTRLHFFRDVTPRALRAKLRRIGGGRYESHRHYIRACRTFSAEHYIGFSVIKPLAGTPVGRTVLRSGRNKGEQVRFTSTMLYHSHYAGVDLTVNGLAFQQQDSGVSACATIALWSSLSKASDLEDIVPATPAQITNAASEFTIPFGRSMPSEGLSIVQMCQAVRKTGLAPHVLRVAKTSPPLVPLYAALRSGFAPVLILEQEEKDRYHAVTGIGFDGAQPARALKKGKRVDFESPQLTRIFVHDDRIGPTVPAKVESDASAVRLTLEALPDEGAWEVSHILLPLHAKIRISLSELYLIALDLLATIEDYVESSSSIVVDAWISKGVEYFDRLRFDSDGLADPSFVFRYTLQRTYSRYVGVIRLQAPHIGTIDVLVDTTSTLRNLSFLSVAALGTAQLYTRDVAELLAEATRCQALFAFD